LSRLAVLLALALALTAVAPAPAAKRGDDDDDEQSAPPPKKPAVKASPRGPASSPFASQGYLECPPGKDIRMGAAGVLAIVAQGGSLIRRQGKEKALSLERGRMGVDMTTGKAAVRVLAGSLTIETAGGKLILDRTPERTRLQVLEGKVLASGAGKPRTLYTGQQLDVDSDGDATAGKVPGADLHSGLAWLRGK